MAFITDFLLINNAGAQGDWTFQSWEPTDNISTSTVPNYIEGSGCQFWPLSKGQTDAYARLSADQNEDIDGKLFVVWFNQTRADISNIPITEMWCQLSDSATWPAGSPYARWDILTQIENPFNTPISGHIPMMVWPTNPGESAGTLTLTSIGYFGFVGTTGGVNDGKQGWFDMLFSISYVGERGNTGGTIYTNTFFDELYLQALDSDGSGIPGTNNRPLGVVGRAGDSFTINCNIQLGDGTADTGALTIDESGKTIFFSNVQPEQPLGYIFVNPASSHALNFKLTDCTHFWTSQLTSHDIFTEPENCDEFVLEGCSFANGGESDLPPWISDVLTSVKNCKWNNCHSVQTNNILFEDNTISNAPGAGIIAESTSHRMKRTAFNGNLIAWITFLADTFTIDGDQFSGNFFDIGNFATAVTADSYAISGSVAQKLGDGTTTAVGQGITGNGGVLTNLRVNIRAVGTPTGNAVAKLYAHTGTFGTGGLPTGPALATSEPRTMVGAPASFEASAADFVQFEFHDEFTLVNATNYFIVIEYTGTVTNHVEVEVDTSAPTHGGNFATFAGSWTAVNGTDMGFFVSTGGILRINAINGANPTTAISDAGLSPPGATIITNARTLKVTVSNQAGDLLQNVNVRYEESDGSLIADGFTDALGVFSFSIDAALLPLADASIIARRKDFEDFSTSLTISVDGFDIPISLQPDIDVDLP